MSAQSIAHISVKTITDKIDNYYICEGNYFRNIIDYDLDGKLDYKKLNLIINLKKMMCNKEEILLIIDKILR